MDKQTALRITQEGAEKNMRLSGGLTPMAFGFREDGDELVVLWLPGELTKYGDFNIGKVRERLYCLAYGRAIFDKCNGVAFVSEWYLDNCFDETLFYKQEVIQVFMDWNKEVSLSVASVTRADPNDERSACVDVGQFSTDEFKYSQSMFVDARILAEGLVEKAVKMAHDSY